MVIAIIGVLAGLLLPAIQQARESARRMTCSSNLRQIGVALLSYESTLKTLPPSCISLGGAGTQPWSAQAFLLPYLEQANLTARIDYSVGYHHGTNKTMFPPNGIASVRIPLYLCPSDTNDRVRLNAAGEPEHYPLSYALSVGQYLVYNPVTRADGNAAFAPNRKTRLSTITDGLSNTIAMSEVKAFTPRFHDVPTIPSTMPTTPAAVATDYIAVVLGRIRMDIPNGYVVVQFTSGLPRRLLPIRRCLIQPVTSCTISMSQAAEKAETDRPNVRDHHLSKLSPGIVHTLRLDGSIQVTSNSIDLTTWQALCTKAVGEVVSDQ